jgi:hypothetical protein
MKKYMIAAGAGVLVLLMVLLIIVLTEDKTGPIITFTDTAASYQEGDDLESLLAYVTADDSVDGDVTESIVVTSFVPMSESGKAKVAYAAKDSKNNITQKEVVIEYEGRDDIADARSEKVSVVVEVINNTDNKGDNTTDNTLEVDGNLVDESNGQDNQNNQSVPDEQSSVEKQDDLETTSDSLVDEDNNQNVIESEDEVLSELESNIDNLEEMSYPHITLNTNEVKLQKGSEFDALSYVESVEDDKDSSNIMWSRIRVKGVFDMDKQGDYILMYYVTDREGNESNREYIWLVVK